MAPNPQLRILSIGNDGLLLWVRSLIFKRDGHDVCSISVSDISSSEFDCDVVVFCSSVEIEFAKAIVRTTKATHPSVRTIRLSTSTYEDGIFDAVLDSLSGPGPLLAELNRIRGTLMPRSADAETVLRFIQAKELPDPNCQETCSSGPFHSTKSNVLG